MDDLPDDPREQALALFGELRDLLVTKNVFVRSFFFSDSPMAKRFYMKPRNGPSTKNLQLVKEVKKASRRAFEPVATGLGLEGRVSGPFHIQETLENGQVVPFTATCFRVFSDRFPPVLQPDGKAKIPVFMAFFTHEAEYHVITDVASYLRSRP